MDVSLAHTLIIKEQTKEQTTHLTALGKCEKQYMGETKGTLRERFTEHRQATNNPSQANASAAVPIHILTYLITLSKT